MAALPMVIRPIRDSVARAASDLAAVADGESPVLPAIRDVALALENHLDTLARELARAAEPRLLKRTERLETKLRDALAEAWAIDRDARTGTVESARVAALAQRLHRLASEEFELVAEQLRDDGALD